MCVRLKKEKKKRTKEKEEKRNWKEKKEEERYVDVSAMVSCSFSASLMVDDEPSLSPPTSSPDV